MLGQVGLLVGPEVETGVRLEIAEPPSGEQARAAAGGGGGGGGGARTHARTSFELFDGPAAAAGGAKMARPVRFSQALERVARPLPPPSASALCLRPLPSPSASALCLRPQPPPSAFVPALPNCSMPTAPESGFVTGGVGSVRGRAAGGAGGTALRSWGDAEGAAPLRHPRVEWRGGGGSRG